MEKWGGWSTRRMDYMRRATSPLMPHLQHELLLQSPKYLWWRTDQQPNENGNHGIDSIYWIYNSIQFDWLHSLNLSLDTNNKGCLSFNPTKKLLHTNRCSKMKSCAAVCGAAQFYPFILSSLDCLFMYATAFLMDWKKGTFSSPPLPLIHYIIMCSLPSIPFSLVLDCCIKSSLSWFPPPIPCFIMCSLPSIPFSLFCWLLYQVIHSFILEHVLSIFLARGLEKDSSASYKKDGKHT